MNTYGDGNTYRGVTSKDSDIYTHKISGIQLPPSHVQFCKPDGTEVMRISKDGVTVSPDVPVDEAAQTVIDALEVYIKQMVRREWVGLTDEEIDKINNTPMDVEGGVGFSIYLYARAIEAKLKEKNT
jgi:hypothetical protein